MSSFNFNSFWVEKTGSVFFRLGGRAAQLPVGEYVYIIKEAKEGYKKRNEKEGRKKE